jgi:8-oxo-dGTP pyrophosphatase MutT (NUDIX family)
MSFKVQFGLKETDTIKNKRESVRAVVKSRNKFLMISTKRGDLIFPGGGIETNESLIEAVLRELFEETGYVSINTPEYLGVVTNIRQDRFDKNKLYKSIMHFFLCEIGGEKREQKLSEREIDLKLHPVWLKSSEIIRVNQNYDKILGHNNVLSQRTEYIINAIENRPV